jgi:hypothetical protein
MDHYVNHARIDNDFPNDLRVNLQHQLGQILERLRGIVEAKTNVALGTAVDVNNQLIGRYRREIETFFDQLPRLDYFESLNLTCDDKVFFETLVMNIKNISLSSQHSFDKIKNITKMQLNRRIKNLKENYIENQMEIFELEERLSNIVDNDLRNELKNR